MKKQKRIVIGLTVIILALLAFIAVFLFIGRDKGKYSEQLELGKKYVKEEQYDEALLCFEAAMNIEPRKEEPYLCMAEVYEIQADYDKMAEILKLGFERTKAKQIEKELERAEELLASVKEETDGEDSQPSSGETQQAEEVQPVELTEEELFLASQSVDVILDWNMHPDNDNGLYIGHTSENVLEEGKIPGQRLNFLMRCFRSMEALYPGKAEDLASNYAQLGEYFEEWAWQYPVTDRPVPACTDWTAQLDLTWVTKPGEGVAYSISNAFYLKDFNRMLEDVFGGEVPAVTVEELAGYTTEEEYSYNLYFLYDGTHDVICRTVADGRTGGDWEPMSMFHNYITKASRSGKRIELEIQKLYIDGLALYQDLVSSRYEDTVYSYDMEKSDYWNTQGKIYLGSGGQALAIDGQALLVLQPIHSYLEDFGTQAYEDMESLEFDSVTGERFMTRAEVFARLQENSAALLENPGILGPYVHVGNQYRVELEEKDGYYQIAAILSE